MLHSILFVDNDPDFLNTRAEFLENAGYRTLKACTLEQARQLLSEAYIHLMILDIRMVDDDDERDTSGMTLASEPTYRSIPKIILTGFATTDKVREALRPTVEGSPPAVDFLAKQEGPETMVQAVERAFTQHVRVNRKLRIQWPESQPLSFPGLVGLFEPDLSWEFLPDRVAEIEEVFRKLFYAYDQLTFVRLLWRRRERLALKVIASSQEGEEQLIVTCEHFQPNRRERKVGTKPTSDISDPGNTGIKHRVEATHYEALILEMEGADLRDIQSFAMFYQARSDKQIRSVLEYLFRITLAPWYQRGFSEEENKSLFQFYQERLALFEKVAPLADIERKMQAIVKEVSTRKIADITFSPKLLELKLSSGQSISGPTPFSYLSNESLLPNPQLRYGLTLGRLDVDAILVDQAGRTWITDFSQVGVAPRCNDFVILETAIRFELVEVSTIQTLYDFEKQMLVANRLSEIVSSDDLEPGYKKAANAIQTIRRLAAHLAGEDAESYYTGLLYYTVSGLATFDPTVRHTGPELGKLLHRLLFASMLCKKIDLLKNQTTLNENAPVSRMLRIDEANREVWVGERQVLLTNTEFDLLLYLYNRSGTLCKRSDIGRDVFSLKGANRDAEDSLLNTNIGRLREKIEPDAGSPHYIVTIRGQGYKLITQPK